MIPDTSWEPTPSDVAWQRGMVRVLRKRATWAVPGALSVFKIDKESMQFMLSVGNPEDETNRRIAKVFKRLGFTEGDIPTENESDDHTPFSPSTN